MSKNIPYAIYVRKSTEGEDRQVQSLDAQLFELQKIASKDDLKIVKIFHESKSAKKPFQRPEFAKLIKMIEEGQVQGLIVWEISRISRNPAESGMIQQLLQDGKLQIIRTFTRSYTADDNAVIFSVDASISNQFIIDLRKNVKRGIREKVRKGGLFGPGPQGYINNRLDKTIELDPERAPHIRKMFDLYLTGNYTVPEIKKMMDDWGYLTVKHPKSGNKPISLSTLYNTLTNPRCAGMIPDPDEEDTLHKANFEPIITWDEYERVQRLLGKKGRTKYVSKLHFELRGLIECGECGCTITAERKYKTLKDGTVNSYNYYHCTGKRPCAQRGVVSEKVLFELLDGQLDKFEISPQLYEWGLKAIEEISKEEIKQRDDIQQMQYMSIGEVQKKLDHLLDLVVEGIISTDDYKQKTKDLKRELAIRQDEQQEAARRAKNWYEIIGKTLEQLNNVTENFATGDFGVRRDILLAIGYKPTLKDKKLLITPNEWLIPLQRELPTIKASLEKDRTDSQQIGNDINLTSFQKWYPGLESNQRPKA